MSDKHREKPEEEVEEVILPDHEFNFDSLKPQKHLWINRGLKLTCENAGHPYHEAWLKEEITQDR